MKNVIFAALLLLAQAARAATLYDADVNDYTTDSTGGTWTRDGKTYGRVTGGSFTLVAVDTVTGVYAIQPGAFVIGPLSRIPTDLEEETAMRAAISAGGLKAMVDRQLAEKNATRLKAVLQGGELKTPRRRPMTLP